MKKGLLTLTALLVVALSLPACAWRKKRVCQEEVITETVETRGSGPQHWGLSPEELDEDIK